MHAKTSIVFAIALSCVLVAGCIGQSSATSPPPQTPITPGSAGANAINVRITDSAFDPANITVHVNQSIIWTSYSDYAHTVSYVTGGPLYFGGFASPTLSKGMTFGWVPQQAGVYDYSCSILAYMKGRITVVE